MVLKRLFRRLGLVAALVITGALVTASPSSAAVAAPGVPIKSLPFFMVAGVVPGNGSGGPGTPAVNDAVSKQCNGGVGLHNPQWFTLPPGGVGKMISAPVAESHPGTGGVRIFKSGVAWVDTVTGAVAGCGTAPVDAAPDRPLSLVAYFADPAEMSKCLPPESTCHDATVRMYTSPTTGTVPANDALANAKPLASLPHTEVVDTTYATPDGPLLLDYPNCSPTTAKPRQHTSVWWKYTPTATGAVPLSVEPLHINPFRPFFPLNIAWVEMTAYGPVLAPRSGPGCDAPVILQAGRTYLAGVSTEDDAFNDARRITGGPIAIRVGAVPTPSAPLNVNVTADESAKSTTITWDVPATGGTSAIAGYSVGLLDLRTGAGPIVTVPATARSYTFPALVPWQAKAVAVAAVNASGVGPPAARGVSIAAPAPSAAQIRTAVSGAAGGAVTATAHWAPPGAEGTSPISGYRVTAERLDANGAVIDRTVSAVQPASARSLTMTLPYAGKHRFTVNAINASGAGPLSIPSNVVTGQ